jgi:hypothetical protein
VLEGQVGESKRTSHILVRVSGSDQHYLPAALIGGFGRPVGGKRRHAQVAVRRKPGGAVDADFPAAETLASRKNMYRLVSPGGVDPDIVDNLWGDVENRLRGLVDRLDDRHLRPGDDEWLFTYAAQAAVRHPSFEDVVADYQARHRQAAPHGDDVQWARYHASDNQLAELQNWRWRVLHSPAGVPRFMLNDRGWIFVGQENWPTPGLLLPMGPRVAILGYLDDPALPPGKPPFEEHLDLCQSAIDFMNAAAWDDRFTELLIAHPDDRDRLASLPDPSNIRVNALGPYRGRKSEGLFD